MVSEAITQDDLDNLYQRLLDQVSVMSHVIASSTQMPGLVQGRI